MGHVGADGRGEAEETSYRYDDFATPVGLAALKAGLLLQTASSHGLLINIDSILSILSCLLAITDSILSGLWLTGTDSFLSRPAYRQHVRPVGHPCAA